MISKKRAKKSLSVVKTPHVKSNSNQQESTNRHYSRDLTNIDVR